MAKKQNTKRKGMGFALFMAIYAVLALTGIFFGLKWFWGFMEAYEASRPHIPIDRYMAELTPEHIVENSDVILENADFHIQSEEECREYLHSAVSGELSYARKASACTDTLQTYVIRSGDQVIGSFSIEATDQDEYGFTPWAFKEEQFDLSFLMGTETISVTVPEGCIVVVNGAQLDESYITLRETRQYALLEELYGSYEVPELLLCTYEAGPFLNAEFEMTVYDATGRPFEMDENFDELALIALKDPKTEERLKSFVEEFLDIYVIFAGCANDSHQKNYERVIRYVVPGSKLAQRMDDLEGMQFAQSRGDEVAGIDIHHYVKLSEGRYLCDVTYKVDTTGYEGVVQTTTNAKLIIVESGDKLLVEAMIQY